MPVVNKSIPIDLNADSDYIVRIRSLNPFGVPSEWSESLVVNTTSANLSSAQRFVITADGMVAYNNNGQMIFYYSSVPAIRTNLVRNPSFELGTTGWTALAQSTIARNATEYFVGEAATLASLRITSAPTLPALIATGVGVVTSTTRRIAVTPGLPYTLSLFARIPAGQDPVNLKIGFRFYNSGGTQISESLNINAAAMTSGNNWVRLNLVSVTAPASAATVGVVVIAPDATATGQYWHIDGVMVEQGTTLREYFDGSTSAGTSYWNTPLAPHDSTSSLDTNKSYSVNGGVFTESTIQTSRTATTTGGVIMDINGLRGYSLTGVNVFNMDSAGNLALTGVVNATGGNFANTVTVGQNASKITIIGTALSTTTSIYSGVGTYGNANTPFYMDASGRFSLGSGLTYNGTNLTVVAAITGGSIAIGANFSVTNTGVLTATSGTFASGTFSGAISSSATITGGTIQTNTGALQLGSKSFNSGLVSGTAAALTIQNTAAASALSSISSGIYFQDPVDSSVFSKITSTTWLGEYNLVFHSPINASGASADYGFLILGSTSNLIQHNDVNANLACGINMGGATLQFNIGTPGSQSTIVAITSTGLSVGGAISVTGNGINYPGATVSGASVNNIAFKWASGTGNIVGIVDNTAVLTLANVSDRRLKTNIIALGTVRDVIDSLSPVVYTPVDLDGTVQTHRIAGLIADEVEEVLPALVAGEVARGAYQSVNYAMLTPYLIKAVQDLYKANEDLQDRLNKLES